MYKTNKILSITLVVILAMSVANASNLRFGFDWSGVIAAFSGEHALTGAILDAIKTGNAITFLNAVCVHFDGKPCYGNARRVLNDNTVVIGEVSDAMSSAILKDQFPNNRDEIQAPPLPYSSADEWLENQNRSFITSDYDDAQIAYMEIDGMQNLEDKDKKGALFVVPGQSEPCAKYDEILLDFYYAGYQKIFCIDHRGQGYSSRLLSDPFKNHVVSSDHFVKDLEKFINDVFVPQTSSPRFLACHSMGCAITLGYLVNMYNRPEDNRDTVFNAIAFNAPLVKANTNPFPYPIAVAIGEVMNFFNLGELYAPTKEKTFEESYDNSNFAGSTTSSLLRWTRHRDRCINLKDEFIGKEGQEHKGLCLGGVTASMAKEFFDLNVALENFEGKIGTPLLFQVAGDLEGSDNLVENKDTKTFFDKVKTEGSKLTNYASSRHQIWMESDSIRDSALGEVDEFFNTWKNTKKPECPLPSKCGEWNYSWRNWGCKNPSLCSYEYRFPDYHLGMSCRPKPITC